MKKQDGYELNAEYDVAFVYFRFFSTGNKGAIPKIIEFMHLGNNLWNLGFGDVIGDTWEDNIVTNNNDFRKVLQTVANAVHQFCDKYPNQTIQIVPLDYQRKLLYNRIFQQKWLEIEPLFWVKGKFLIDGINETEHFSLGKRYDEFVILRKY